MNSKPEWHKKRIVSASFEHSLSVSLGDTGWRVGASECLPGTALRITLTNSENDSLQSYFEKRDDKKPCFAKTEKYNVGVLGRPGEALPTSKIALMERVVAFLSEYERVNPSILSSEAGAAAPIGDATRIKEYRFSGLDKLSVVVILNSRCDWKCCFCRGTISHSSEYNDNEHAVLMQRLRELSDAGETGTISITGSEPLNYPGCIDVVNFCTAHFPVVQVQTTGMGLNRKSFLESLREPEKITFVVPLYGDTPEVHDAITGCPGSFAEIAALTANKSLNVRMSALIIRKNSGRLRAIREFCSARGRQVEFTVMYIDVGEEGKRIYVDNAPRLSEVVGELKSFMSESEYRVFLDNNRFKVPYCISGESVSGETVRTRNSNPDGTESKRPLSKVDNPDLIRCRKAESCAAAEHCPGIYRTYIEMYRWDEFTPIT